MINAFVDLRFERKCRFESIYNYVSMIGVFDMVDAKWDRGCMLLSDLLVLSAQMQRVFSNT